MLKAYINRFLPLLSIQAIGFISVRKKKAALATEPLYDDLAIVDFWEEDKA